MLESIAMYLTAVAARLLISFRVYPTLFQTVMDWLALYLCKTQRSLAKHPVRWRD